MGLLFECYYWCVVSGSVGLCFVMSMLVQMFQKLDEESVVLSVMMCCLLLVYLRRGMFFRMV